MNENGVARRVSSREALILYSQNSSSSSQHHEEESETSNTAAEVKAPPESPVNHLNGKGIIIIIVIKVVTDWQPILMDGFLIPSAATVGSLC